MLSYLVLLFLTLCLISLGLTEKVCGTNLVTYESAKEVLQVQDSGVNLGIIGFGSCEKVCVARDPYCGSDARTYYNYCHLVFAVRRGEQVSVRHAGHCGIDGEYVGPPGNQPSILENVNEDSGSDSDSSEVWKGHKSDEQNVMVDAKLRDIYESEIPTVLLNDITKLPFYRRKLLKYRKHKKHEQVDEEHTEETKSEDEEEIKNEDERNEDELKPQKIGRKGKRTQDNAKKVKLNLKFNLPDILPSLGGFNLMKMLG